MSSTSFPNSNLSTKTEGPTLLTERFIPIHSYSKNRVLKDGDVFLPNKGEDAYLAYSAPDTSAPKLLNLLNKAVLEATSNNESGTTASFATIGSQGDLHFSVLGDSPVFLVLKDPQLVIKLSVDMDIKSDFYTSLYLGHQSDPNAKCFRKFGKNPFNGLACAGAYGDKSKTSLLKKPQYYDFSSGSILSKLLEEKLAELLGDQKTSSIQDMIQKGSAKVLLCSDGWAPEKTVVLAHDYELSFDFFKGTKPYSPFRTFNEDDGLGRRMIHESLGKEIAESVANSGDFLPNFDAFEWPNEITVQASFKQSTPAHPEISSSQKEGIPSIYHVLAYPQDHQDGTLKSLLSGAYLSLDDQSAYVLTVPKQEQINVVTLFDGHSSSRSHHSKQAYENAIPAVKKQMQSIFQPNNIAAAVAPDNQQIPTPPSQGSSSQNNGLRPLTPPTNNENSCCCCIL